MAEIKQMISDSFSKTEIVATKQKLIKELSFDYRYPGQIGEKAFKYVVVDAERDNDGRVIKEYESIARKIDYAKFDMNEQVPVLDADKMPTGKNFTVAELISMLRSFGYYMIAKDQADVKRQQEAMQKLLIAQQMAAEAQSELTQYSPS